MIFQIHGSVQTSFFVLCFCLFLCFWCRILLNNQQFVKLNATGLWALSKHRWSTRCTVPECLIRTEADRQLMLCFLYSKHSINDFFTHVYNKSGRLYRSCRQEGNQVTGKVRLRSLLVCDRECVHSWASVHKVLILQKKRIKDSQISQQLMGYLVSLSRTTWSVSILLNVTSFSLMFIRSFHVGQMYEEHKRLLGLIKWWGGRERDINHLFISDIHT